MRRVASARIDGIVLRSVLGYLTYEELSQMSTIDVRMEIFGYYFKNLNMSGHKNDETVFEITDYSSVPHAHNLLLQMAFWFGVPSAIFYIGWVGYGIVVMSKKVFGKHKDTNNMMMLLFYVNIIIFGMVEIVWLTGQISLMLLFLIPSLIFSKCEKKLKNS